MFVLDSHYSFGYKESKMDALDHKQRNISADDGFPPCSLQTIVNCQLFLPIGISRLLITKLTARQYTVASVIQA